MTFYIDSDLQHGPCHVRLSCNNESRSFEQPFKSIDSPRIVAAMCARSHASLDSVHLPRNRSKDTAHSTTMEMDRKDIIMGIISA